MIFPEGGDVDVITPTGMTNVITISFSERLLNALMPEQYGKELANIVSTVEVVTMQTETLRFIRHRCWEYLNNIREFPELVVRFIKIFTLSDFEVEFLPAEHYWR